MKYLKYNWKKDSRKRRLLRFLKDFDIDFHTQSKGYIKRKQMERNADMYIINMCDSQEIITPFQCLGRSAYDYLYCNYINTDGNLDEIINTISGSINKSLLSDFKKSMPRNSIELGNLIN